jgi:ankyrin repeat protein
MAGYRVSALAAVLAFQWVGCARPSAAAEPVSGTVPSTVASTPDMSGLDLIRTINAGDRRRALDAIRRGATVRGRDADGSTALHWAANQGDTELVRALLAAGAEVRASNDFGATPMSAAAEIGDAPVIEMLLKAGADVDSPNGEGETALMTVARTGRVDAARLLLKRGANPNAREHWGDQTALMWAAAQCQPAMIRLLLDHGAAVDLRSATRAWQRRVTAEPRPKDMSHGGFTALLYAAREGCVAGARELLRRKADVNLGDPDGVTPLILALMNIHWDFARYLIESGADVNLWDFYGRAPLYAAVDMNTLPKGRHVELPSLDDTSGLAVIRMLLDRGANPNAQLKLRVPHRQIPYDRYTEPMLNIGATPLLRAAKAGDVDVVKLLLGHGALPDLPNFNGDTPLMAAVGKGWINAPTRGAFYTEEQALEVYGLLRSAGADVNAHTHVDETPLHSAALRGWNEIVKRLVTDGAVVDAKDRDGLTPLDFAMGRIPKQFNAVVPTVRNDTADLLRSLGATLENPNLPPWPAASTPRITAWVPADTALLPPQ